MVLNTIMMEDDYDLIEMLAYMSTTEERSNRDDELAEHGLSIYVVE